jgi:hypothetical protein
MEPNKQQLETDPRFPSGKWIGFWVQRVLLGRQYMAQQLTFTNHRITGQGADVVGDFLMTGKYDLRTGGVVLHKRYLDAHDVLYEGRNENDGLWLWGLWSIRSFDRGGFHIWPAGEDDPTGRKLHEELELPHERRRVKLVPSLIGSDEL